jgi:hypothetical protein
MVNQRKHFDASDRQYRTAPFDAITRTDDASLPLHEDHEFHVKRLRDARRELERKVLRPQILDSDFK